MSTFFSPSDRQRKLVSHPGGRVPEAAEVKKSGEYRGQVVGLQQEELVIPHDAFEESEHHSIVGVVTDATRNKESNHVLEHFIPVLLGLVK